MKVKQGYVKSVTQLEDGNEYGKVKRIYKGETVKTYTFYKVRKLVKNKQEETEQYLKFSRDIEEKRSGGQVPYLKDTEEHHPCFTILFPKHNTDGSYVVQMSWWEND